MALFKHYDKWQTNAYQFHRMQLKVRQCLDNENLHICNVYVRVGEANPYGICFATISVMKEEFLSLEIVKEAQLRFEMHELHKDADKTD